MCLTYNYNALPAQHIKVLLRSLLETLASPRLQGILASFSAPVFDHLQYAKRRSPGESYNAIKNWSQGRPGNEARLYRVTINTGPGTRGPGTQGPEDRGPEDQGPNDHSANNYRELV